MATIDGDSADNALLGTSENDIISGFDGNDVLTGSDGDDVLLGGAGFDNLNGGPGNDTLDGGPDGDIAAFSSGAFGVTVDLNIPGPQDVGAGLGFDTLIDIEALQGTSRPDMLIGNGLSNQLLGGAGNDVLIGGGGDDSQLEGGLDDDTIDGGPGLDTASYINQATSGVTVDLRIAGPQLVGGGLGADTLVSIENIRGSRFDDTLIGDDGPNVFTGRGGNDVLNGGQGIDMASYSAATGAVTVNLAKKGAQLVSADEGSDTLIGIENVRGSIYNDRLTGDARANLLQGNAGDDLVDGGRGNDTLVGGAGADMIKGGGGADQFVFMPGHVPAGPLFDTIGDFSHREHDVIDLSALDAVAGGANDGFSFLGAGAFTGIAGQLHYARAGKSVVLEGDTNGDGVADFSISVLGAKGLVASDFIL